MEEFIIQSIGQFYEERICSWNWPIFQVFMISLWLRKQFSFHLESSESTQFISYYLMLLPITLYQEEFRTGGNSSRQNLGRAGVEKDREILSNSNIQLIAHPASWKGGSNQGWENQEEWNSFPIPQEQTDYTHPQGKGNVKDFRYRGRVHVNKKIVVSSDRV